MKLEEEALADVTLDPADPSTGTEGKAGFTQLNANADEVSGTPAAPMPTPSQSTLDRFGPPGVGTGVGSAGSRDDFKQQGGAYASGGVMDPLNNATRKRSGNTTSNSTKLKIPLDKFAKPPLVEPRLPNAKEVEASKPQLMRSPGTSDKGIQGDEFDSGSELTMPRVQP